MRNASRASAVLLLIAVAAAAANVDASPYGEWRGRAQFGAKIDSIADPDAHAVTDLKIVVDSGGKVWGESAGNGCKASGLLRSGRIKRIFELDVTLSGCKYRGLNRRYAGRLAIDPAKNYASFSLHNLDLRNASTYIYDVKATLRR